MPGCGHTFCLNCIQQIPKTSAGFLSAGILPSAASQADSSCPLCRTRFHSRQIVPNFALQHLTAEGPSALEGMHASVGAGRALDLQRGPSNVDVAAIYRDCGVPPQLSQVLAEEDRSIALRVYILDNSGSMSRGDGSILYPTHSGLFDIRKASRWEELKQMAREQAEWNAKIGVPSEFVLLNSPNPSNPVDGRDLIRIDAQRGSTKVQLASLRNLLECYPGGGTPLTERLHDLRQRLRQSAPELREHGRKLMLILVTDGVPNGCKHDLVSAIRCLANELPVHIVVRLCTNDDSLASFYNEVDKELEISLDILDDFQGESRDIYHYNPWLTYSHVLHKVREAGTLCRVLDLLDERPLTPMEVGLCAQLLLRADGQPQYPWQPAELLDAVEKDIASAPFVFCIKRRAILPVLNMQALRAAVLPGKHSVTGQLATAVGLGGVAEAWYEGRTLLDAFRHPKVTQNASAEGEDEDEEDEDEEDDGVVCQSRQAAAHPLAAKGYPQAIAVMGGCSQFPWRHENHENTANSTNSTNPNHVATADAAPLKVDGSVAPNRPVITGDELQQRELWTVGSCVEVFSSSASKWYIAQVKALGEEQSAGVLTVQFIGDNGQILQKSMPRSDAHLAFVGRNTRLMPPNFQKVSSESRPGQFSYQDTETGAKYATKELAWENHYIKILQCEQAQDLLKSRV